MPIENVDNEHFAAWWNYWGLLKECEDPGVGVTKIYGFENETTHDRPGYGEVPDGGATYGFVLEGAARLSPNSSDDSFKLREGQFFHFPDGLTVQLDEDSRVVVTQKVDFRGVTTVGGPIEELGRLKYIDGCSDTLLVCPPLLGDPCFNHLHFPKEIDQTEHNHPSNRSGGIARGRGDCITPYGETPLIPGLIFHIPWGGLHRFRTGYYDELDVIAYHPDSDWGPTDEEHPMINRTWVDGEKIDNSSGVHTQAAVVR